MKFSVNREHLTTGLSQVINIVGTRSTMPILGNVLIEGDGEFLSLTTTNLDQGIRCKIRAQIKSPGRITLPVRKLATIIRSLPNLDVEMDASSQNKAKITSGGSIFTLMGIDAEEFTPLPKLSGKKEFRMSQDDLLHMLKLVSHSQSHDENRRILNGVFFNLDENRLLMVATDGKRLSLSSKDMEVSETSWGSMTIPTKTIAELERLLGQGQDIIVQFNENQVSFLIEIKEKSQESGLVDSIFLISKVIEGKFPDYKQVIPKETVYRIQLDRELLQECVQRASLVTSERNNAIRMKFSENLLEIEAASPELGEAHESMAISYNNPPLQIAFNPQYILDPLKAVKQDEIFFEFKDELSPGVFKTKGSFLSVIMPLRLNASL